MSTLLEEEDIHIPVPLMADGSRSILEAWLEVWVLAFSLWLAFEARRLRNNWIRRRSFEQRCLYRPHGQRDSAVWKLSHRQGDHKVVVPRPIFFDLFLVRCSPMLRGAYGYGTCLSKLVSHPFFTNHTYGTQEEKSSHNSRPAGPQILVICCIQARIFRPLSGDGSLPPQPGSFKGALWLGALVPASSGYWIYPCWQGDCLISPIYIEKYRL